MEAVTFADTEQEVTSLTQQFIMVSSMYCQLLVVICVVFFTSEVVTFRVPLYYFEGFYMYLYSVSLLFLLYVYIYLLRRPPAGSGGPYKCPKKITILENLRRTVGDKAQPNKGMDAASVGAQSGGVPPRLKKQRISENDRSHGKPLPKDRRHCFRSGDNGVQRLGVRLVLRDSIHVALATAYC
ncbi:hypothetical protein MRX96_035588 [Rhipicephalus microplus]